MITLKNNLKKALAALRHTRSYNSFTSGIIDYLSQPYSTIFGYLAVLENYGIINQSSIKKHTISLLIDITTELQQENYLTSADIKDLQAIKTLFMLEDEDFKKHKQEQVETILFIQSNRIEKQFIQSSNEIEHNYSQLKELFGIKDESYTPYIHTHSLLAITANANCTPI